MSKFARDTEVSPEKSRMEIEQTLMRYGASEFMYGIKPAAAAIAFKANGRHIRFIVPLPQPEERRFDRDGRGAVRTPEQRRKACDQEVRQRYRALYLCIKAKLEAVESRITTFEDEFMAHIVLPGGRTMSEHAGPLIQQAYETGQVPPLLPHLQ